MGHPRCAPARTASIRFRSRESRRTGSTKNLQRVSGYDKVTRRILEQDRESIQPWLGGRTGERAVRCKRQAGWQRVARRQRASLNLRHVGFAYRGRCKHAVLTEWQPDSHRDRRNQKVSAAILCPNRECKCPGCRGSSEQTAVQ